MLYDIRTTAIQLKKLGEWVSVGPGMADVELCVDDTMLLAEQGDDRMAWDLDGSEASEKYLSLAPLDPARGPFGSRERALDECQHEVDE